MTTEVIQAFIETAEPVNLTIKKTRTKYDHATVTLDHIDGRCVVSTEGKWFRMSRITGIGRVQEPTA